MAWLPTVPKQEKLPGETLRLRQILPGELRFVDRLPEAAQESALSGVKRLVAMS